MYSFTNTQIILKAIPSCKCVRLCERPGYSPMYSHDIASCRILKFDQINVK